MLTPSSPGPVSRKLSAGLYLVLALFTPRSGAQNAEAPTQKRPPLLPIIAPEGCGLPSSLLSRGWPRTLTPTTEQEPTPAPEGSFTFAVLPDTQYYASCRSNHIATQARWVRNHARSRNIVAAIHLGDMTEHNTAEEWSFVEDALTPVTSGLPTFLATGNHDHGDGGTANRRFTRFADFFSPPAPPTARHLVAQRSPSTVENAYYRLGLPKVTIGVLVLEWSPRKQTVEWANRVLARYPSDRVIFVTHAYLYYDGTRYDWAAKGKQQEWNPNAYGTAMDSRGVSPGMPASTPREAGRVAQRADRTVTRMDGKHSSVAEALSEEDEPRAEAPAGESGAEQARKEALADNSGDEQVPAEARADDTQPESSESDGARREVESRAAARAVSPLAFDGEKLWQELVSKHAGIMLTLNGHVLEDGTAHLTSPGPAGNDVHQLLSNYQALEEGGLGYLRLLEFSPDGQMLTIKTYSPSLDRWATDPEQYFSLPLEPPLW